jgi:predicted DNA binding protein
MSNQNEENLKGLLERFVDAEQAQMSAEDIRRGEQILGERPGPEPSEQLIAEIKAEVGKAVVRRKANALRRMTYKAAAVAAGLIILAAVGVKIFEQGRDEVPIVATEIWESRDIAADDADLATLTAEIEQIESDMLALQLGENGSNGNAELTELEMEVIEVSSDFWKG